MPDESRLYLAVYIVTKIFRAEPTTLGRGEDAREVDADGFAAWDAPDGTGIEAGIREFCERAGQPLVGVDARLVELRRATGEVVPFEPLDV